MTAAGRRMVIAIALVSGCDDAPATSTTHAFDPAPLVAAERELRDAVDAYEAQAIAGGVTPADRNRVIAATWDWPVAARRGGYEPNSAIMAPRTLAYAGRFDLADGRSMSVVVGTGQTGMVLSKWVRGRPDATSMPGHGLQTLAITPEWRRDSFRVDAARRASADRVEVPYHFEGGDRAGTIALTNDNGRWTIHVDRGAFDGPLPWTGWWNPDLPTLPGGATTRPR